MCLNLQRQQIAVECGAVPLLLDRMLSHKEPSHVRQLSCHILAMFPNAGNWVREELWKYNTISRMKVIADDARFLNTTLDALVIWYFSLLSPPFLLFVHLSLSTLRVKHEPLRVLETAYDPKAIAVIVRMVRAARSKEPCEAERAYHAFFLMCQVPRVAQCICAELLKKPSLLQNLVDSQIPAVLILRMLQTLRLMPFHYVKLIPGLNYTLSKCAHSRSAMVRLVAERLQNKEK